MDSIQITKQLLGCIISYFVNNGERNNLPSFYYELDNIYRNSSGGKLHLINIDKNLIEEICNYCEVQAIYDKLGRYNDFYYKLKRQLR